MNVIKRALIEGLPNVLRGMRSSLLLPEGEGWDEGKGDILKQFWCEAGMRLFPSPSPLALSLGERGQHLPQQWNRVRSVSLVRNYEKLG